LSLTIGVLATLSQTLAVPAVAPQPSSAVRAPARPAKFGGLLAPAEALPTVQLPPSPLADAVKNVAPRIVCGMVVVPVDAAVDRRMVAQPPSDVSFAMKVIVPPVCVD
jgi:hypothetical protein